MTLVGFLVTAPGDAAAQSNAAGIPKNAHAKEFGSGWLCNRGYREVKGACSAIKVPANAHLDYTGNGWECSQPFQKQKSGCALLTP